NAMNVSRFVGFGYKDGGFCGGSTRSQFVGFNKSINLNYLIGKVSRNADAWPVYLDDVDLVAILYEIIVPRMCRIAEYAVYTTVCSCPSRDLPQSRASCN